MTGSENSAPTRSRPYLRWSALLIVVGLLVELMSFGALQSPTGFLAFALGSGSLVVAGIGLYLFSLVRQPKAPAVSSSTHD